MNIDITGHHLELTEPLRQHVTDKLAKLSRHFDHVTKMSVILTVEKHRHIANATLNVPGGTGDLFATATHEDMYSAIDQMAHKLDRQIIKHKEKLTDHHEREKTTILDGIETQSAE